MIWLLDTNACVDFLRHGPRSNIANQLTERNNEDIVVCSIVKAELYYGALCSNDVAGNLVKVNQFLDRFQSVPFDDVAAMAFGSIRRDLEKRGLKIGPYDLLIASIAFAHDLVLVTHNTKEFGRISELSIDDWEMNPSG